MPNLEIAVRSDGLVIKHGHGTALRVKLQIYLPLQGPDRKDLVDMVPNLGCTVPCDMSDDINTEASITSKITALSKKSDAA